MKSVLMWLVEASGRWLARLRRRPASRRDDRQPPKDMYPLW